MDKKPLTKIQLQIFYFMREYFSDNDQLPPASKIREHFGHSSINAAREQLESMEKKGWIARNDNDKYKFIR